MDFIEFMSFIILLKMKNIPDFAFLLLSFILQKPYIPMVQPQGIG